MAQTIEPSLRIPISQNFFCDGKFYVLTSTSLGGSQFTPLELSTILGEGDEAEIEQLLSQGVCLPLFFDCDCELDGGTLFVVGDLTTEEATEWIGRLVGHLNIPCGKLVLLCGGGDEEELAQAISGDTPDPDYEFFQVIDLPAGEYLVEIYAYLASFIAQDYLEQQEASVQNWFQKQCPGASGINYLIRLAALASEPPLPKLVPEIGWCGEFEFRQPEPI